MLQVLNVRTELFKYFYDAEEFVINDKADAFEAFDHLIGIIHGWVCRAGKPDVNAYEAINSQCEKCFIHETFYQKRFSQAVCECTRKSEVAYMSENLFAMQVNMINMLDTLDQVETQDRTSLGKIIAIKDAFINALCFKLEEKLNGCVDPN